MPRLTLRDGCLSRSGRGIVLDDDWCPPNLGTIGVRMSVYNRSMTGRDQNGDAVYDWTQVAEDVPIILEHHRFEWVDGVTIVSVRIKAMQLDQSVSERSALDLDLGSDNLVGGKMYRVTKVEHTGLMTYIEAERQMDLD